MAGKRSTPIVVELDRLIAALDAGKQPIGDTAVSALDSASVAIDPLDPRNIGYQGAYPQIQTGYTDAPSSVLKATYKRSAAAKVLVDRVPSDTWGPWLKWTSEDEELKKRLERVCKNPEARAGGRPLWWWFERADRPGRRDGRALLYFILEDGTGDRKQKPQRVKGIRCLQVVLQEDIAGVKLGNDPKDAETYMRPVAWLVNEAGAPDDNGRPTVVQAEIHPGRIVPFIPKPKEKDLWDGDSVLDEAANYIEWGENINYHAAEAFARRASPMVAVSIEPGVSYSEAEKAELRRQLQALKSGALQIIVAKGIKVEVVQGSSQLPDPTPYHEIALQNLAMVLGVPKAILIGDAAGDLAASQEDSRRQDARMMRVKDQYADPIVREVLAKLFEWDFTSWPVTLDDPVDFTWNGTYEPTEKERAEILKLRAEAKKLHKDGDMPLDEELDYKATAWPVPLDADGEPVEDEEESVVLNGAQVEAVLEIVTRVGKGEIGPGSAEAILTSAFPLDVEEARRIIGDTGALQQKKQARADEMSAKLGAPAVATKPGEKPGAAGPPAGKGPPNPLMPPKEDPEEAHKEAHEEDDEGEDEAGQDAGSALGPKGVPTHVAGFKKDLEGAFRVAFNRARPKLRADKGGVKRYAKAVGKELRRALPPTIQEGQRGAYGLGGRNVRPRSVGHDAEDDDGFETAPFRSIANEVGEDVAIRYTERIRESLLAGAAEGETLRELTARVQDVYAMTGADAERIARTESIRAYNRAARDNMRRAGYDEWIFVALNGADPECADRDGKRYSMDDMEDQPPIHPNCRCSMRAPIAGRDVSLVWDTWEGGVLLRLVEA